MEQTDVASLNLLFTKWDRPVCSVALLLFCRQSLARLCVLGFTAACSMLYQTWLLHQSFPVAFTHTHTYTYIGVLPPNQKMTELWQEQGWAFKDVKQCPRIDDYCTGFCVKPRIFLTDILSYNWGSFHTQTMDNWGPQTDRMGKASSAQDDKPCIFSM